MSDHQVPMHGGRVHPVAAKGDLAEHIGREHIGPNGRFRRVTHPPLNERRLWRRDELDQAHADLHGPDAAWDAGEAKAREIAARAVPA